MNIGTIAANNEQAGQFFWSKGTRSFFRDCPSNWSVVETPSGRVFIRHVKKGHRLYGQVREVFDFGASIGSPIDALEGLTPSQIKAAI